MKQDQFSRTRALIGKAAMERLAESHVAIFGLGGVGGHAVEALVRSGVGELSLFDDDKICLTNLNRQIIATRKTVGAYKADTMAERVLDINPNAVVHPQRVFYGPEVADQIDLAQFDYVIDAIDTVTAKLELATRAAESGTPIICAMGAANKLDPTAFEVTDIFQTKHDPLARVMRRELRKRGIERLRVVYSNEPARKPVEDLVKACSQNCVCPTDVARTCTARRQIPASNAFVPGTAGLILAGEVIKALIADVQS